MDGRQDGLCDESREPVSVDTLYVLGHKASVPGSQVPSCHSAFYLRSLIDACFLFVVLFIDLRNNEAWFPEKIYYTATPQEVRDYRLESQRLAKNAAAAALPLEDDIQDKTWVLNEPAKNAIIIEQQALEKQQPWVNQLRKDMRAEFREELREQLETQNEQIVQLQAQLSEILAVLRAGSKAV